MGGSAGAGMGGSAGASMGGSAGASMGGSAGAGMGGGDGPTGSIESLNDDEDDLLFPTTGAFRGQNIWFTNGQLDQLGGTPTLPFTARSVPLAGGDVGAAEIELPGDDFFPEGIAAGEDGTLYIGSVGQSTIVRVPANSTTAEDFLADGVAETGVIGLKVDDDRELLWFCDSNPQNNPSTAAVVGVSLDDGEEVVRHNLAAPGVDSMFCNDLIVDPDGNLWVTESFGGIIYRIDADDVMNADSAEIWMQGGPAAPPAGGFGPNGLTLVGGQLVVANAGNGNLFVVDPDSTDPEADAQVITLSDDDDEDVSLCGPDGLLTVPGSNTDIVVIENGGCANPEPRIARITLDL